MAEDTEAHILDVVRRIPHGRVATYGQVAELAGLPGRARLVGRCLANLPPGSTVPWHRVVNARGQVSLRGDGEGEEEQVLRLLAEGLPIDDRGRLDLPPHRWRPRR